MPAGMTGDQIKSIVASQASFFSRKKSKTSSDTFWNISLSFFGEVYYNNPKADEDIASDVTPRQMLCC